MKKINEIKELYSFFEKGTENSFEFELGKVQDIILSAPHAVSQTREGKVKFAEPESGIIAKLLNKYYGYTIIYKSKNMGDDANFDADSPYKKFLCEKCKELKPLVVLDLHELSKTRECQVNIGSGYGNTVHNDAEIINNLINCLNREGIKKIVTDHPFASKTDTIATNVSKNANTKAMQVELNYGYLTKRKKNLFRVIKAIHNFCTALRTQNEIRQKNIDISELYSSDEEFYKTHGQTHFVSSLGDSQNVISAPHAKAGMVNNKVKLSESMTGVICKVFNREFNFSTIYKSRDNNEDYFNSLKNPYKEILFKKLITKNTKLVLELHIINKDRFEDLLMFLPQKYDNFKTYQIINILNKNNIGKFSINSIFDQNKKTRITNQVKGNSFKLQLCFNARLIEDKNKFENVILTLKDIISIFVD